MSKLTCKSMKCLEILTRALVVLHLVIHLASLLVGELMVLTIRQSVIFLNLRQAVEFGHLDDPACYVLLCSLMLAFVVFFKHVMGSVLTAVYAVSSTNVSILFFSCLSDCNSRCDVLSVFFVVAILWSLKCAQCPMYGECAVCFGNWSTAISVSHMLLWNV